MPTKHGATVQFELFHQTQHDRVVEQQHRLLEQCAHGCTLTLAYPPPSSLAAAGSTTATRAASASQWGIRISLDECDCRSMLSPELQTSRPSAPIPGVTVSPTTYVRSPRWTSRIANARPISPERPAPASRSGRLTTPQLKFRSYSHSPNADRALTPLLFCK